jgi:glycosyltransferase involved in cell wall biosynthesis
MNPKVSIIIPCYNAEKWIKESLLSALTQTHGNKEVIFVDNESTDNSLDVAKEVQESFPELLIYSAPNIYKYSWEEPVERALEEASGEYFTILGADDYIAPNYVENIVNILSAGRGKIKVLQTPLRGVQSDTGNLVGDIKHEYKNLEQFKSLLFERCPVTTPTVVYEKKLHDAGIIRWDSKQFLGAVDYELYFNIAHHNIFIYPYPRWCGYYYRWHKDQATWGMRKEIKDYDSLIKNVWKKRWKLT